MTHRARRRTAWALLAPALFVLPAALPSVAASRERQPVSSAGETAVIALASGSDPAPDNAVELSLDGRHWANPLTASPFDDLVWVPGDSEIGSIWVRTVCPVATGLAVWELDPDTPAWWADDLLVRTRTSNGSWGAHTQFSDCQATTAFTVTAGVPLRLDLQVNFPYGDATQISINDTQDREVVIDSAVITLTCDGGLVTPAPPVRQCPPAPGDGNGSDGADNGQGTGHGTGGGEGSGPDHDGNPTGGSSAGGGDANSASGILAYANNRPMPLSGIETARLIVASGVLISAGIWIGLSIKRRRGATNG